MRLPYLFLYFLSTAFICTSYNAVYGQSMIADAELYVIDSVDIEGDAPQIRYTLNHIIDLKPGTAFTRDDLDIRLSDIKQRLFALDYFETIDIRLEKSQVRRHFKLVFNLKPYTYWYLGYRMLRGWDYQKLFNNDRRSVRDYLHAFGGTRDFLNSGLTLDIDYRNSFVSGYDSDRSTERVLGESRSYSNEFTTTLISPQWLENRVFFGGSLALVTHENFYKKKDASDGDINTPIRTQERALTYGPTGILGVRLGLWTLTGGASRLGSYLKSLVETKDSREAPSYEKTDKNNIWHNEFSGEIRFSEKTYLAALESGFAGLVRYSTSRYENLKATQSIQAKTLYSWMFDKTLLTPVVRYQIDYETSKISHHQYDYSLVNDVAIAKDILIGFEYGFYRDLHLEIDDAKRPPHRILGRIQYLTHHFNIEVAFMYGNPGLGEDKLSLLPLAGRGRL